MSATDSSVSRRELLAALGGAAALAYTASACSQSATPGKVALAEPLYFSSVRALADGIARTQVSSEEVVRSCLDRIAAVGRCAVGEQNHRRRRTLSGALTLVDEQPERGGEALPGRRAAGGAQPGH